MITNSFSQLVHFALQAQVAGKISVQQLNLGMRLGDPYLQSRCKLFYSISLIQVGHLRAAKYIIRQQYCFAIKERDKDIRLLRMCKGIWLRLQYEYLQRQLRNPSKSNASLSSEQMLTGTTDAGRGANGGDTLL